jgi:Na+/H+ antiporter NhaC
VALITTWIGAELGYIQGALATITENAQSSGLYDQSIDASAYSIFLGSLQYAYYPVFSLIFILLLIYLNKDFGPMLNAEKRARAGELQVSAVSGKSDLSEFEPAEKARPRMINAILPIAVVILGTVAGLIYTGFDPAVWNDESISFGKKLSLIIGNSDSYKALLWSSMAGLIVAVMMTVVQRTLTFSESIESSISGFKTMIDAIVILVLAWSLAALTDSMYTADFLAQLAVGNVAAWSVPAITFIMAAMVAFSTGSSWGTMAIVYPLMLPLSWQLSIESGLSPAMSLALFYNVTSCVLAGAVLGDHCSPISDTTILSSLATQCDHIAHVRSQMPYALTVGVVSVIFTVLVALFSIPWYLVFPLGTALLFLIIRFIGKDVPEAKLAGD